MEGAEDCQVQGFLVDDDLAVVVTKKNTQKKKNKLGNLFTTQVIYIYGIVYPTKRLVEKKRKRNMNMNMNITLFDVSKVKIED